MSACMPSAAQLFCGLMLVCSSVPCAALAVIVARLKRRIRHAAPCQCHLQTTDPRNALKLESLPSSTETSFYPDLKALLSAVLKAERLPFDVITGTAEGNARSRDMPDFVLGDSSLFVGGIRRRGEARDIALADLAVSTDQNDQIGRYLAQRPASSFSATCAPLGF